MKKIILSFIIFSFLAVGCNVMAEEPLPDPGILPDNSFYFLKSWKESIQIFFTFGAENKAKQFLRLSEIRLAEYLKMIEKGKTEIAQKTLEKYKRQLDRALEKSDEKTATSEKILKHQEILENVLEKASEAAKPGIEKAIEASQEAKIKMKQKIEESLKQASPEVQNCVKSMISKISEGEFKGESDIQTILLGCLSPGKKIPSGEWLNMGFLKNIEEFYGKSLSPQDSESLKKVIEQYKDKIPQGAEIPSDKKTLDLEDIKKIQEKMQEEYENIPLEERERIKQMQEQQENITPPEIPGGSPDPNGGMGM